MSEVEGCHVLDDSEEILKIIGSILNTVRNNS